MKKNTAKEVLRNKTSCGTDFPLYGKNTAKWPTIAVATSATIDKLPRATVGSFGNLQITTPFP